MNYQVVPLGTQGQFELNGVRFNGKSFMYWKKKDTTDIREVVIILDKKHENIEVRDGVMVLSLKGLTSYQDLRDAIRIFLQILNANQINIQLHFIVENENQRQVAEMLGNELGVSYVVQNVNQNREQELQAMEEQMKKNADMAAGGNHIIRQNNNGSLREITIHNGVAYENNGMLNSEEEKASLLREWMKNPVRAEELRRMTEEARNELLTQAVLYNRKQYRLEDTEEQLASDEVGRVAMNVAERESGKVNSELGVVQHDSSSSHLYSAIERDSDRVNVVNPNVVGSNISTSGLAQDTVSSSRDVSQNYDELANKEDDIQQREVGDQVVYVDEDNNILNNDNEIIGVLGKDGYDIDYDTNSIIRDGKMVGYIGDYNDMGRENSNSKAKPNVRVLRKSDEGKSAAFISFPVIMFVLSALLLIGSVVLLFVLD